jgi:aspartate kinase
VFSLLASKRINVDIILQSIGRGETKDISFTVDRTYREQALQLLEENKTLIGFEGITCEDNIAKVSIVGAGMATNAGVASRMFEALAGANVNIQMISTSEIKISVLIDINDADRAMVAIHDAFYGA